MIDVLQYVSIQLETGLNFGTDSSPPQLSLLETGLNVDKEPSPLSCSTFVGNSFEFSKILHHCLSFLLEIGFKLGKYLSPLLQHLV